ncbi:MAG: carboxypeptidase regulatory-like domain-containing protein [Pedosphaera sp.]|nr:carboxypeptidase regulatory-like domain-containing protein [Pedosphaera sp.]
MRFKNFLRALAVAALALRAGAEPVQPLDLKPFVGRSPFDNIGATWLPPRGPQVIDGTPFQIDGVVLMFGDYPAQQRNKPGLTNVNGIVVGRSFECLHLFATAQAKAPEGTPLVKVHFQYADFTSAALEISYGVQVRNWFGPWHQTDTPMADPNAREVWRALFSAAATTDNYLRMYHVALTNPFPAKEVRTLALESLKKTSGLMIAAMSVGPRVPEPQPDTLPALKSPFPDLRPREGERVSGEGVVKRATGEPLAGAHVRVMAVRTFTEGYFSGTENHEAVGVEAMSDADGRFTLPPLPDNRVYNLMAFAEGFEPTPFGGADVKSDPIELRLKPLGESPKFFVRGRVIGPDDRPLASVTVEPQGVGTGTGTSWGGSPGFPEQTITGTNGEFVLGRRELFTRLQVRIKSPGFAPGLEWLDATNAVQTIQLGVGAIVRGRVLKNGAPLGGVGVGVAGANRSSETFAGHFETKTDSNGVFAFEHLPPDTAWYFYGLASSFKGQGALSPIPVNSLKHGETTDLGDLTVKPGLRLAGEVKSRRGEPLPRDAKVRVSRDQVWDSVAAPVDTAGRFAVEGLSAGQVSVSIEPRTWHLASVNRSLNMWSSSQLSGVLEGNKEDLLLVIEPGEQQYSYNSSGNGQLPTQDWPQNHPLFGAEKSGPFPIVLAGRVLDDKTSQPLPRFKIIPGYKPPVSTAPTPPKPVLKQLLDPFTKKTIPWNEQPHWMFPRAETWSNGNFAVEFLPLTSSPLMRVEAEGYLPFESDPMDTTTSNLVIRLKAGTGPGGVVLLPDGKPAEGATILYAAAKEQFGFSGKKLSVYGSGKQTQAADKDGKFSFPMKSQGQTLFVTHDAGWAEESVERGGDNLKLRLQPWAVLSGTLVDANAKPMSGVELALTMPHDWQRGDPFLNFQAKVTTDAQGRFQFTDVPPRRIEVQRMIPAGPAGSRGWTYRMQTWLFAKPGTNDLGKVIYDQPPPPPLLEQIKKSIGL